MATLHTGVTPQRRRVAAMNLEPFSRDVPPGNPREAQLEIQGSEAILEALLLAATRLSTPEWRAHLDGILRAAGQAVDVSRVYCFENSLNGHTRQFSLRSVWGAPETLPKNGDSWSSGGEWSGPAWQQCQQLLGAYSRENGQIAELERPNHSFFGAPDSFSTLIMPIEVEGEFWGGLGFDECRAVRAWSEVERELLGALGAMVGAAITRSGSAEALRDSQDELRALLSAVDDAVFVLDSDGRYCKIVAGAPDLLFRPGAEMLGRSIEDVIGGEQGREFLDVVRDVLATNSSRLFEYSLPIDGKIGWFSACVSPLSSDRVLWVARDVTPAHGAHESLRESEALFRLLAENSTDKIARFNAKGEFLYVSPSVKSLLGYAPEELIGTVPFEMIHPADQHIVTNSFDSIMNSPGVTDIITYRMRRRDGVYLWFETS